MRDIRRSNYVRAPTVYGTRRELEGGISPGLRRLIIGIVVLLILLWVFIPVVRAAVLFMPRVSVGDPSAPKDLAVKSVQFNAADGVTLHGWLVPAGPKNPAVVLVPGFKDNRSTMLSYARFLHGAGFTVLLYDSRGTGGSGGTFGMGMREVNDVKGAVWFLQRRAPPHYRKYGILGVSLGAGVAIVAGSQMPGVAGIVADSAYTDQKRLVDRMDSLHLGPLSVPLAPLAPWTVDRLLGARLSAFSPLHAIPKIAPRPLLLIQSRHDANPTTPLSGARKLLNAAGPGASLWIAPKGGHAGALAAQPAEYQSHVVGFFRQALGK